MGARSRAHVLHLYRQVLKAAQQFPSKKRASIIVDIKAEFREGAGVTEAAEVSRRLKLAQDGLARLLSYSGRSRDSKEWSIALSGPATSGEQ